MVSSYAHTFIAAGAALLLALLVGRLVFRLHLPRVTGYLITGLLVGPSLASWLSLPPLIDPQVLAELRAVSDVALGLILLSIR